MSAELESDSYDVVVLGTGLAESIAAAALARVGKSVLHLDPNGYYASDQASLTLDELVSWASERSSSEPSEPSSSTSPYAFAQSRRYTKATTSEIAPILLSDRRRYALSLFPTILPSRGSLISTLIASDVSKYVGFRLLDSVGVWEETSASDDGHSATTSGGRVRKVPGSKEEVFKDKSISLVDKRRLMKFLMFVAGDFEGEEVLQGKESQPLQTFLQEAFSLPPQLATQIIYAISHASSPDEPALPALRRTQRYLRSLGRYGAGAFLVGQYGGAGEIAQGFCRACAVKGGTYVLGEQAQSRSIELDDECVKNHLPSSLEASAEKSTIASATTAHCIAVLPSLPECLRRSRDSGEEGAEEQDDTAVILFPREYGVGLVRALLMGAGTGSCPAGQYVLYLSTSTDPGADPATLLQPYLERITSSTLFTAFYLSNRATTATLVETSPTAGSPVTLLEPYAGNELLTEGLDWEAEQGEAAFWAVMGGRPGEGQSTEGLGFFDKEETDEPGEDDQL